MESTTNDETFPGNGGPANAVVVEPGQCPRELQARPDRHHTTASDQSTVSCTSHEKQVAVGLNVTASQRSHQEDNPVPNATTSSPKPTVQNDYQPSTDNMKLKRTSGNPNSESEEKRRKLIQRKIKERKIRQLSMQEEPIASIPNHPTHYVLSFPGIDIESELNIIRANNEIIESIGKPKKVTKLNKNSLLIIVNNLSQSEKIKRLTEVASQPVTVEPHRTLNSVRGTVYSEAMTQSSDEEILHQLGPQRVIKVERMKKRQGDRLVGTNRFILTFEGTYLPSLITIAEWQREIVEPYIPKPLQCNRCQRLGHTKKWCRLSEGIEHCSRCSVSGHRVADCESDPYCINCRGSHPPRSRDCPEYKFRCEVLATQARNHITRKEATEQVRQTYRTPNNTYSAAVKRNISENSEIQTNSTKPPPTPKEPSSVNLNSRPSNSETSAPTTTNNKSKPNFDETTQMDTYLPDLEEEVDTRKSQEATPSNSNQVYKNLNVKSKSATKSAIPQKNSTANLHPNPHNRTIPVSKTSSMDKLQNSTKNTTLSKQTPPARTPKKYPGKDKPHKTEKANREPKKVPKRDEALVQYEDTDEEQNSAKVQGNHKRERPADTPPKNSPKKTKVVAEKTTSQYAPIPVIGASVNHLQHNKVKDSKQQHHKQPK